MGSFPKLSPAHRENWEVTAAWLQLLIQCADTTLKSDSNNAKYCNSCAIVCAPVPAEAPHIENFHREPYTSFVCPTSRLCYYVDTSVRQSSQTQPYAQPSRQYHEIAAHDNDWIKLDGDILYTFMLTYLSPKFVLVSNSDMTSSHHSNFFICTTVSTRGHSCTELRHNGPIHRSGRDNTHPVAT